MSATRRRTYARGFTLIEIMVAVTLLTIVLAIVYGSYSSVVMSVERTRAATERMKTTQFIVRGFAQNLAQASEGWSPGAAYRPYSAGGEGGGQEVDQGVMRFPFVGEVESGRDGRADVLSFASTAPMTGGGQLPGQIKQCSYRLEREEPEDGEEPDEDEPRRLLVMTETPWAATGEQTERRVVTAERLNKQLSEAAEDLGQKPVSRSTPVYGWDLAYFDGKDWVEEWHSEDAGHLPWSVRVRVKLESPEDDPFADEPKLDPEKDPTVIELFFTVPAGAGIHDAPPDYVRPSDRENLR